MIDWQNILVLAGAVVFMAFLLWRMRPVRTGVGAVGAMARTAMAARVRARQATSRRQRAEILCEAADQIAGQRGGSMAATSLYLRALHAEPTWPEPIARLRKLLWLRRPRALERLLWNRLGHSPWNGDKRQVAAFAARALSDLYRGRLHNHARAEVMGHLADLLSQPPDPRAKASSGQDDPA